ncbi:unnamed protein product, partial [Medioppia subpectinata]
MSDKYVIQSPLPSVDIPVLSVGEFALNYLQKLDPNHRCIIDACLESKWLTVSELIASAQAVATALLDRGLTKQDLIVTFANNSVEHSVLVFAAIFLGITLYPIGPVANVHELRTLLPTLGSIALFTDRDKSAIVDKVLTEIAVKIEFKLTVMLDGKGRDDTYVPFSKLLAECSGRVLTRVPHFPVEPETDIYIMLQSSGTSGVPKSVRLSHRAFVANIYCNIYDRTQHLDPLIFSEITPFGSVSGQMFLYSYLLIGATVVMYSRVSEEAILSSVKKYGINTMFMTPLLCSRLVSEGYFRKYDLSSVKLIMCAGAALPTPVAELLVNQYGINLH